MINYKFCLVDVQKYLKKRLPNDGYCVIGVTWADLYPSEELNFILGEAQCNDGCAVVCFGHYEPQQYSADCSNNHKANSVKLDLEKSLLSPPRTIVEYRPEGTPDANRLEMWDTQDVRTMQTMGSKLAVKTNSAEEAPITCLSTAASKPRTAEDILKTCAEVDGGGTQCANHFQEKIEERYRDQSELISTEKASGGGIYRVWSDTFGRINRIDGNLIWRMLRVSIKF